MIAQLNRLMALLTLCSLLVPSAQAEPVDSVAVKKQDSRGLILTEDAEGLRAGLVLEASEIDSSTVEVGESRRNMSAGKRVALKLLAGTLGGMIGAVIGSSNCDGGQEINFNCVGVAALGYWAGTAIGTNAFPRHRSISSLIKSIGVSLGGSAVGLFVGLGLTLASPEKLWPSLLVAPVVGATWASERWRKPPPTRRISVGLVPNPRGSVSAIATLRF